MRSIALAAALAAALSAPAFAGDGFLVFDPRTGGTVTVAPRLGGGTTIDTFGPRNGDVSSVVIDPRTGETITVAPRLGGGTMIDTFDPRSGDVSSVVIDRHGNQRGFDRRGDFWMFDRHTGFYRNFGTGRTCLGNGLLRTCR